MSIAAIKIINGELPPTGVVMQTKTHRIRYRLGPDDLLFFPQEKTLWFFWTEFMREHKGEHSIICFHTEEDARKFIDDL